MQASTVIIYLYLRSSPNIWKGLCPVSAGQSEAAIELDFQVHYWIPGMELYIQVLFLLLFLY